MDYNPLISIIIPTYNRAAIIEATLDSVRLQTYTNWDCYIVDDGSNDDTAKVVKAYAQNDSRFKYFERPKAKPKGANACRNFGLEHTNADYNVFLDSDDMLYPQYLELQLQHLISKNANYSICQSQWQKLTGEISKGFNSKTLASHDRINDYISFKIFWPIQSVLYKTSFLKQNNLKFNESLQQSQEYDFHIRLMQKDANYAVLNKVLTKVIAHQNSTSYSKSNAFLKTNSSLRVRLFILKNKKLNLSKNTILFVLDNTHSIFKQQILAGNKKASLYAAFYYLKAHFAAPKIGVKYIAKHFFPLLLVLVSYHMFGKGYTLLNKSNTFNYKSTNA